MSTILSNGNFDFGNGYFDKDDFGQNDHHAPEVGDERAVVEL